MDPTRDDISDAVARVTRTTFGQDRIGADGHFNHISLRFIASAPASATEPAILGSAVVHFDRHIEEDS
jgi:hypothetical protein